MEDWRCGNKLHCVEGEKAGIVLDQDGMASGPITAAHQHTSPLKRHLGGKYFADDDDVQHEVLLWMKQQPKEFYAAGI
ncbi:hypothetical protein AVEN_234599-1 [Araneus ventricosus]|uniref:Uncharacterized protein n=1 Tax=Araneus ventricosus TaxID=182803 RepID=A0A4Y2C7N4_ARAVE|nr:hypothetical protein AVEN_234599-1 [Araneus ventricosus]